ncbi:MAG TPA: ATP-binding protein [Sporichthyaceae bacterium]|jgi:hypothetical protein|nr:ATP-binding protein [Sporichthyaceae bacterium]
MGEPVDDLRLRLLVLTEHVRALVAARRIDDPNPDDPFRGLYLTEDHIGRILDPPPPAGADSRADGLRAAVEAAADSAEAAGQTIRLRRLAARAGLGPLDVEILLVALAPDVDTRFERLYGYLNDDVTRRRPTIGLALELTDASPFDPAHRARLAPGAPLLDRGLITVEDPDRPFLTRGLRVPDRVTAHLLGDDAPDPALTSLLSSKGTSEFCRLPQPGGDPVAAALAAGVRLLHLREEVAGSGVRAAADALGRAGHEALPLDLAHLDTGADPVCLARIAVREALLRDAALVVDPVERLANVSPEALRILTAGESPVVLVGMTTWDPAWSAAVPLSAEVPGPGSDDRTGMWAAALAEDAAPGLLDAVEHFVLGPVQVEQAVRAARASAACAGRALTGEDLRRGCRAQNAAGLQRLARRVEPAVGWEDLVLPGPVERALRELAARARHRDRVLTGWRMRPGGGRGRGVIALFAGESGTGKTMSAEVLAADLGLDLYTVNLSAVVDKYVGETEKNLERIFVEAAGVNAILLFDEADAIFAKRGEVRDAHDRYANIESAYLLQRLETFEGLAVLATNLRANIDEAFTRRLDAVIDFPAPDQAARRALWQRCLAPPLPCRADIDLEHCARNFVLSGGNIRSVAITAAYLAAGNGGRVGMPEILDGIRQEYRKLGRLLLDGELDPLPRN